MTYGLVEEPKVRRDGRCVVCKKPRKVPSPLQKGVPAWVYENDPFCSATCSRAFFGNPIRSGAETRS